ncbi:hypothetical protein IEQ34_011247 [Dendrobium chrysotoxum]|uniref:ATPase AAA-type core domain-containing protein n=1 Tax=Dendrobium chrysotoxum TaxID=161865 RepID=A0AAV7GXR2_DENCH|nr:hypothetical protein IEQ34_011247 [Dendrobium chrysotoxum]
MWGKWEPLDLHPRAGNASRKVLESLQAVGEGAGNNDQKVLVLAATNTPYALDQAIRHYFDKQIYIPLSNLKAQQHMFKVHLGDTPNNLMENDFESLARRMEGFFGSDISICVSFVINVKDVLFEPVRKTQDAMISEEESYMDNQQAQNILDHSNPSII